MEPERAQAFTTGSTAALATSWSSPLWDLVRQVGDCHGLDRVSAGAS